MLTEARTSPKHYRADSLAGRVVEMVSEHPEGISAAELAAALRAGTCTRALSGCCAPGGSPACGEVCTHPQPRTRWHREHREARCQPADRPVNADDVRRGRESYVDQGVLPRNVIALVERPKDADAPARDNGTTAAEPTAKSWTLAEVQAFRESVREHRLYACWLLSCYGLRRSEVLGLRWNAVDLDTGTLSVRRGRVAVGGEVSEGAPKSRAVPPRSAATGGRDRGAAGIAPPPAGRGHGARSRVVRRPPGGRARRRRTRCAPRATPMSSSGCVRAPGCAVSACTGCETPRCRSCSTRVTRRTSSRVGTATTRRWRCRSIPMSRPTSCARSARHCSGDANSSITKRWTGLSPPHCRMRA